MNVMVVGGTSDQRLQAAYAFHRESFLRRGPFICVDGERDEHRLRLALHEWLSPGHPDLWADPLSAAEHGTLYLDSVASLSRETQRVFLAFTRRLVDAPLERDEPYWMGRLTVGNAEHLSIAVAEGRFLPSLYDSLDKVRFELPKRMEGVA